MKIIQKDNEILRLKAKSVPISDLASPEIKKIIKDMSRALASCDDGVALAAPQIGVSLRIFIISSKLWPEEKSDDLVFINPKIIKKSKKLVTLDEGCLSVRWLYGKTKRAEKVTIEAFDLNGKKITWNGNGLIAQIFQHEIDHLDGILFTDHATDLEEIKPE